MMRYAFGTGNVDGVGETSEHTARQSPDSAIARAVNLTAPATIAANPGGMQLIYR